VVFSLQFFFIGDEGLSQFFLVGGGSEKYVPPDPLTHLILEQPLVNMIQMILLHAQT
jgi:hypothetical protein